jgi:hypothetical protein
MRGTMNKRQQYAATMLQLCGRDMRMQIKALPQGLHVTCLQCRSTRLVKREDILRWVCQGGLEPTGFLLCPRGCNRDVYDLPLDDSYVQCRMAQVEATAAPLPDDHEEE